ncbi:hypothetical protein QTO34_000822 [Cnephaeus nilssonii]|uniref:ZC3H15/TMA46 family C-terminal domain-containing protein n=1 Tax=Cnephaeus nilssonii TaxID=3371016 RepID=A0AA40ID49_CNENI|nr:hypothetical protein QTO34_000822 [Eptesicus nilssonii]
MMSQTFEIISITSRRKPWYGEDLYFSDSCARKLMIEIKKKEKEAEEPEKQLFQGTPDTIGNFLSWKAKSHAELLEIKKKRVKVEEQARKNKLSPSQFGSFLEDAGNTVEVDESVFQEMDDLGLEDDEDDSEYNPADPESDLTD